MRTTRWIAAAACLILTAACTEPEEANTGASAATAASTLPDASIPPDTGTPDAGTPNAGTPNAGTPNAGTPDTGAVGTGGSSPGTAATDDTDAATDDGDGPVVAGLAGETWAFGTVPSTATEADDSLDPVVIGMINQENSPVGSFPELRHAAETAVRWINAELGGVNGRPLRLETCITSFAVEQSQACAQQLVQAGAVAVVSGIDITANGSLPVLEQNGIPMISAIPTTLAELRGANSFSFSGGIAGAYMAFVADAHARGAESIAIAYGQFESFEVPATEYGARLAESLGMEVTLVPFPITTADFLPVVQTALDADVDALTIGAADSACLPVTTTLRDLGWDGFTYLVGACAAEEILAQIPDDAQAGVIFNSEGLPGESTDGKLYVASVDRYAADPSGGAGTVSFRTLMNLWHVLTGLDDPTPAAVTAALRGAVDAPSFWGHPYTCDGQQIPGLPALCSPQQTLISFPTDGDPVFETEDWIDVPALAASLA